MILLSRQRIHYAQLRIMHHAFRRGFEPRRQFRSWLIFGACHLWCYYMSFLGTTVLFTLDTVSPLGMSQVLRLSGCSGSVRFSPPPLKRVARVGYLGL